MSILRSFIKPVIRNFAFGISGGEYLLPKEELVTHTRPIADSIGVSPIQYTATTPTFPTHAGNVIYVQPDPNNIGKIRYRSNDWPTDETPGTENKTLEDAALAAGSNGTVWLDGGNSGVTYSDSQLGTILSGTMYTKAENVAYRGSEDAGHEGQVTVTTTTGNRTIRLQHSATFDNLNINNDNASATTGAIEVQLAISQLYISQVATRSQGTGGGGHGLYVGNTVGDLTLNLCDFSYGSGMGMFINHATGVTGTGIVMDSKFNHNANKGVYGNLNNISFISTTPGLGEFAYNSGHGHWADGTIGAISSGSVIGYDSHNNKDDQETPAVWYHGFTSDGSGAGLTGYIFSRCRSWNCSGNIAVQDGAANVDVTFCELRSGDCTAADFGVLHFNSASNCNVLNNTIIDSRSNKSALGIAGTNSGNICKNNIFLNDAGGDVVGFQYAGFTFDYNCYYSAKADSFLSGETSYDFAGWKTLTTQDANSQFADPLLNIDYTLSDTSPCKNTGIDPFANGDGDQYDGDGYQVWSDIFDASVYHWRDGVDIGAYAYGGGIDVKNTPSIISGTNMSDYVLEFPICPTLYAADAGVYTGIVPNQIDLATFVDTDQMRWGNKGGVIYNTAQGATAIARIDKVIGN